MYDQYPIYSQFNYIIDRITIDGKTYYLDATERGIGFGYLPLRCYNNHARVVNEAAETVQLNPGSILEKKTTDINLSLSKNGLNGTVRQVPGYYESHSIRRRSAEKGIEALAAEFKGDWGNDFVVSELRLDSLNNSEAPLAINYRFTLNQEDADILYIDPVFINAYKENPFKSSERLYPVEMPYALDDEYLLSFEIPEDYIVDELPRDLVVKLNVLEEGIFDYKVSRKGNNIQVRSHLVLKKAEFQSHEYNKLREFFGYIVKKQAEQIVLKKKK
jgi:hypothetical protein